MDFTLKRIDQIQKNSLMLKMIEGKDNTYSDYYWCRRSVEYIVRLMYSITVDLVIQNNPNKANRVLIEVKEGNLGAYHASACGTLINALPKEMKFDFIEYWKILKQLIITRNEDAHEGHSPKDLKPYILENRKQFKKLEVITNSKFFSFCESDSVKYYYLHVPSTRNVADDNDIFCTRIDENGNIEPIKVERNRLARGNDIIEDQLYLSVITSQSTEYYRLSPFIGLECDVLYGLSTSPTMYMGVVQFWSNEVTVEHRQILDDEKQKEDVFKVCNTSTLIPRIIGKNYKFNSIPIVNGKKHIDINLSEYPGYSKITSGGTLPYFKDICPAVKAATDFCMKRPESYQVVCGEGGVGKTALIFYLIHDLILKGKTTFSRVIFLSAKRYFRYTDKEITAPEQEIQIIPDIDNFQDFLEKISQYLYDDEILCNNVKAEVLIDRINGKYPGVSIPNTFLVVDDLDTLSKEDQHKVINFLKQINPKKMNALITTREKRTNGYHISLTKLDKQHSLLFLKWCIDQEKEGYGQHISLTQNPDVLYHFTEGRPLDIKLWSNLIIRGFDAPQTFNSYWTKKQRTMYLYQTTLNRISEEEQLLFKLLCHIFDELQIVDSNLGIPVSLINYLYPWKSENEIDDMIQELSDVRLITMKRENIFIEDIDYLELLKNASIGELPSYNQRIINDIHSAPMEWSGYSYRKRLIKYLANCISEGKNDYEHGVLKRLYEDADSLTKTELNFVTELMLKYGGDFYTSIVPCESNNISACMELLKKLMDELDDAIECVIVNPRDEATEKKVISVFRKISDISKMGLSKTEKDQFECIRMKFIQNGLSDFIE